MTSLSEAIHKKYLDAGDDEDTEEVNGNGGFIVFAPNCGPLSSVPNVLVISSSGIDRAGDTETLAEQLKSVRELDISHNSLTDLNEIGTVLAHASRIKFVNIGFNDLASASLPSSFPHLEHLSTLILVGCNAPWKTVWFLLRRAKNVSDLHLSVNKYKGIYLPAREQDLEHRQSLDAQREHEMEIFANTKTVMFDNNPVTSWEEISKLGLVFPNLCHLSLIDCPISIIPNDAATTFQSLKTLWISNTLISDINQLENLKLFPALNDLRLSGIPLFQDFHEQTRRQHFIALLPNIEVLNRGRSITSDERENAERNFIRYYLDDLNPPTRYLELKAKHDDVQKLAEVDFKPPTDVELLIRYEKKEVARVRVKLKQTVSELKNFLEPIIGVNAAEMELHYLDVGLNAYYEEPVFMNFPNKQLFTYRMNENDEIFVRKRKSDFLRKGQKK